MLASEYNKRKGAFQATRICQVHDISLEYLTTNIIESTLTKDIDVIVVTCNTITSGLCNA